MVWFWHRLLNQHEWKTVDEYRIEGIDPEKPGFNKIIHQQCTICGDRKTFRTIAEDIDEILEAE